MAKGGHLKKIVVVALVVTFLFGVLIFLFAFKAENIEIVPGSFYTEDQIKAELFTSITDKYTYLFALKAKVFGIKDIPLVEKIDIEVVNKNSLKIYVYDKPVMGCVSEMGRYVCFDREGIVTDTTADKPEGIPCVKGLTVSDFVIGKRLELSADIFDSLMNLTTLLEKNGIEVRDIEFDFKGNVTLYIGDDEVLLGRRTNFDLPINNLSNIMESMGEGSFLYDLRYMSEENMSVTAKPLDK